MDDEQIFRLVALFGALAVAGVFLLWVLSIVVRLFIGLARPRPRLVPIARCALTPGAPQELTYASTDGRPHGLYLDVDVRWRGSRAYRLDVDLRVQGGRSPVAASFTVGQTERGRAVSSPLVTGVTAFGGRERKGFGTNRVTTQLKLCDVTPTSPGAPIAVDLLVRPRAPMESCTLALIAAPDPPLPALPAGLGGSGSRPRRALTRDGADA